MEQRTAVLRQAILLALFSSASMLACGHRAGLLCALALTVGLALSLGFASSYRLRARFDDVDAAQRDARRQGDRDAARSLALGFGLPLVVALVLWLADPYDGLSADAAALVALALTVGFSSVLVSSMVDWYWIVPSALGLIGEAIWLDACGRDRRRDLAQAWVFHRGLCELLFMVCFAVAAAVSIVAVGNAFHDETVATAIEALGGAGVAFGAVEYLVPRLRGALDFALAGQVGLGMWVKSDRLGLEGLVVDVSIRPGLKVVGTDRLQEFVALADASKLAWVQDVPETEAWRKAIVLDHFTRDPRPDPEPSWWQRLLTPRRAAIVARALLVAFAACLLAAQLADPGRGPLKHTVSELVHGPAGPALLAGFGCWAVALLLTAYVLEAPAARARYGREARGMAVLLVAAAVGVATLAVFATQAEEGRVPEGVARTTAGRLHDAGALLVHGTLLVAVLTSAYASWRRRDRFGVVVAALLATAATAALVGLAIGDDVGGLRERVVLLCGLTWLWLLLGDALRAVDGAAASDLSR